MPGSLLRRDAGMTAFEAAIFAFVVVVTIALLLRSDPGRRCRAKHHASQATVQDFCVMMNIHSFDIWASGCGDAPACDPETSEPATKATIKNW